MRRITRIFRSITAPRRRGSSAARSTSSFCLEPLEPRVLLSFSPTAQEQLMLEYINRFRANPQAELNQLLDSLNPVHSTDSNVNNAVQFFGVNGAAIAAQFATLTPAPPLAWNATLYGTARAHSQLMIDNNTQSHQLPGEQDLGTRIQAAGYTSYTGLGENIFAFAESVFDGEAGLAIDWGSGAGTANGMQTPPGHRNNLLSPGFAEIGIGILTTTPANNSSVGPLVVTEDFGNRTTLTQPFLLGVVYNNTDGKNFYSLGEGIGGVTVTAVGTAGTTGTFNTTSMAAGGYQLQLPPGTYNVTFSGGTLASNLVYNNVVITSKNKMLDGEVGPTNPGTRPPTIGLLQANAASYLQGASMTLTASDVISLDGSVSGVEFFRDSNANGSFDASTDQDLGAGTLTNGLWTLNRSTAGFAAGSTKFFARAKDSLTHLGAAASTSATITAAPSILVKGNGQTITSGSTSPQAGNFTDLGSLDVFNASVSKTFTILDQGGATLNLTGNPRVQITGPNAGDFTLTSPPAPTLAAGGSTSFTLKFDASHLGLRTATITITSNDPSQGTFTFAIQGTGTTTLYDEATYLHANPDVAANVGVGKAFATGLQHFLAHGQLEGRPFSPLYSESYYLAQNPDVAAVVGSGKAFDTGLEHFLNYGMADGRRFSPFFDQAYYLEMNPDVGSAVGAGKALVNGTEHFVAYGQFENRMFSPLFNAQLYLQRNPDVASAVGAGKAFPTAFDHFFNFGQYEGRAFSVFYNEAYYLSHNSDVAALVGNGKPFRNGLAHFIAFGQFENRAFSPFFNTTYYLAQNPSVAATIGAGKAYPSVLAQFADKGEAQGLAFSTVFNEAYYLAHNTDIVPFVGFGKLWPFGFYHYVIFGQYEGRVAVAP